MRDVVPLADEDGSSGLPGKPPTMNTSSMRLDMRGNGPQHLRIVRDVDVAIHGHDSLEIRVPAEQPEHDLARFAVACLVQRDVGMEVRARVGIVHGGRRAGKRSFSFSHHFGFARQAREVRCSA